MNPQRPRELWAAYLAGRDLADEEKESLFSILQGDAGFRDEALEDAEVHGLLRSLERVRQDAEPFVRSVGSYFDRERDAADFVRKVDARLSREEAASGRASLPRRTHRRHPVRPGGSRVAWAAGLAGAAAVLVAVAARLAFPPDAAGPRTPRPAEGGAPSAPQPPPGAPDALARETMDPSPPPPAARTRPAPQESKVGTARPPSDRAGDRIGPETRDEIDRHPIVEPPPRAPAGPADLPQPRMPAVAPTRASENPPRVVLVERVEGSVSATLQGRRQSAQPGQGLLPGDALEAGAESGAVLLYPDGTTIEVGPQTELREATVGKEKRVYLSRGVVRAEVARQPAGQAAVFETPHAAATVLGTTLRLVVEQDWTQLEVTRGRVRLSRGSDGASADVSAGQAALAAPGVPLVSRPMHKAPLTEVMLLAGQGRIAGKYWRFVQDTQAFGGTALEVPVTMEMDQGREVLRGGRDYVEFAFLAEAGLTYHVWVRGRCMAAKDPIIHDGVTVVALEATYGNDPRPPDFPDQLGTAFQGYSHQRGYWWIGGDADPGPDGIAKDIAPRTIQFKRPGIQRLRVFPFEAPVRIDAIRLSATQRSRPQPRQEGPARGR